MIDEKTTFKFMKYCSFDLSYSSNKKIYAVCKKCNTGRWINFQQYRDICKICKNKKPHSEEHKRKISESCKGKNYNINLTDKERKIKRNYPEYNEWRKAVYEYDNYICQICNDNKGHNLNIHHIESYNNNPELRINIDNGITMCEECHKNFHHQYGYGNNTKEQFIEFKKGN